MVSDFRSKKRSLFLALALVFIGLPMLIIAYEIIFSGEDSIVISVNTDSAADLIMVGVYVLILASFLVLGVIWFINQIRSLINLKNEKMKVELVHLQSQINPHFFFNMLNNLYGLVDKNQEKTKEMIINLSGMMRYSIYDGQKESVSLREEIDYLRKFIQLNQSRYQKKIEVTFETEIKDEQKQITPLLFIILLENAFKHGVELLRKEAYVRIVMKSDDEQVVFRIENNFDPEEQSTKKGMGLKNLKRRLELIYPREHALEIEKTHFTYIATLTLNLQ